MTIPILQLLTLKGEGRDVKRVRDACGALIVVLLCKRNDSIFTVVDTTNQNLKKKNVALTES